MKNLQKMSPGNPVAARGLFEELNGWKTYGFCPYKYTKQNLNKLMYLAIIY